LAKIQILRLGETCFRLCLPSLHKFASELFDRQIDLGVPSRLPAASRPNPKPISEKHLRELGVAAKQLFPLETSFSFRVWIQFLNGTGCRRSESEIDWTCVDWLRRSVVVRGKTGERELPLSRKMIRCLQFLYRRGNSTPWTGHRAQRLSAGVLYCLFKQAAEKIGRRELRRTTFATEDSQDFAVQHSEPTRCLCFPLPASRVYRVFNITIGCRLRKREGFSP
jgi:hypothetical protein